MRREKAFTLIEVILALGVFAIVAIPIVNMFLSGIRITTKSENTSEAYAYAQQYIEKLKGGEITIGADKKAGDYIAQNTTISGTAYKYTIKLNSTTVEPSTDGEDFYKYMNTTDSSKVTIYNSYMYINSTYRYFSNFDSIKIDNNKIWRFMKGNSQYAQSSLGKTKFWLVCNNTNDREIKIDNQSGEPIDIYIQNSNTGKVTIKNIGGVINVYGPIKTIPTQRGRKKTSEVTVTVKNTKTGENAELTANVIHY